MIGLRAGAHPHDLLRLAIPARSAFACGLLFQNGSGGSPTASCTPRRRRRCRPVSRSTAPRSGSATRQERRLRCARPTTSAPTRPSRISSRRCVRSARTARSAALSTDALAGQPARNSCARPRRRRSRGGRNGGPQGGGGRRPTRLAAAKRLAAAQSTATTLVTDSPAAIDRLPGADQSCTQAGSARRRGADLRSRACSRSISACSGPRVAGVTAVDAADSIVKSARRAGRRSAFPAAASHTDTHGIDLGCRPVGRVRSSDAPRESGCASRSIARAGARSAATVRLTVLVRLAPEGAMPRPPAHRPAGWRASALRGGLRARKISQPGLFTAADDELPDPSVASNDPAASPFARRPDQRYLPALQPGRVRRRRRRRAAFAARRPVPALRGAATPMRRGRDGCATSSWEMRRRSAGRRASGPDEVVAPRRLVRGRLRHALQLSLAARRPAVARTGKSPPRRRHGARQRVDRRCGKCSPDRSRSRVERVITCRRTVSAASAGGRGDLSTRSRRAAGSPSSADADPRQPARPDAAARRLRRRGVPSSTPCAARTAGTKGPERHSLVLDVGVGPQRSRGRSGPSPGAGEVAGDHATGTRRARSENPWTRCRAAPRRAIRQTAAPGASTRSCARWRGRSGALRGRASRATGPLVKAEEHAGPTRRAGSLQRAATASALAARRWRTALRGCRAVAQGATAAVGGRLRAHLQSCAAPATRVTGSGRRSRGE